MSREEEVRTRKVELYICISITCVIYLTIIDKTFI